jgi:hypothetical protein
MGRDELESPKSGKPARIPGVQSLLEQLVFHVVKKFAASVELANFHPDFSWSCH